MSDHAGSLVPSLRVPSSCILFLRTRHPAAMRCPTTLVHLTRLSKRADGSRPRPRGPRYQPSPVPGARERHGRPRRFLVHPSPPPRRSRLDRLEHLCYTGLQQQWRDTSCTHIWAIETTASPGAPSPGTCAGAEVGLNECLPLPLADSIVIEPRETKNNYRYAAPPRPGHLSCGVSTEIPLAGPPWRWRSDQGQLHGHVPATGTGGQAGTWSGASRPDRIKHSKRSLVRVSQLWYTLLRFWARLRASRGCPSVGDSPWVLVELRGFF
jgi:hypothetical protein